LPGGNLERPRQALRATTTGDLAAYLKGSCEDAERDWLSLDRQHEEAWFLGLRLNTGVEIASVEREFGRDLVAPALEVVTRLEAAGLLASDGRTVRLTPQGQLLANEVFQEFLGLQAVPSGGQWTAAGQLV
jgi:oxygen-independent coproporphyrinogen-3 oxidase